jgi:signal transduction histidine kinase
MRASFVCPTAPNVTYPVPNNEAERLRALVALCIRGTGREPHFDAVAELGRKLLQAPIAFVAFQDEQTQSFKAHAGLPIEAFSRREAICNYALLQDDMFVVPDLKADERFASMPYVVGEPYLRFYAGMPLAIEKGLPVGTFCIMDTRPRELSPEERETLGQLAAIVVSFLKQYESEAARRAAEAASQAKSLVLSSISHELRTPLGIVLGAADIIRELTSTTAEQQRWLETVKSAGSQLLSIIDGMLIYVSLGSGNAPVRAVPFSIHEVVADAAAEARQDADRNGVAFVVEADPGLPPRVRGDPDHLRRVLLVLLANAIKFTPKEGTVALNVEPCESRSRDVSTVEFSVTDTGIGIAPDRQEQIFEPLTQGDSSLTRVHRGMGMGLAIAKRTVEAMGGAIRVESAPEKGMTFSVLVTFPMDPATDISTPDLPVAAGAPHWLSRLLGKVRLT